MELGTDEIKAAVDKSLSVGGYRMPIEDRWGGVLLIVRSAGKEMPSILEPDDARELADRLCRSAAETDRARAARSPQDA